MESAPVALRHPLEHKHLAGDIADDSSELRSSHRMNAFRSPRIIDELVTREVEEYGRKKKIHGEIFAIITPDHVSAESSPHHPVDQYDSICLVRYPDTKEVGIASRAARPDGTIYMHPGMMLEPDKRIYFGRGFKGEQVDTEKTILGREALTGVSGVEFGNGVSRIHGYIDFYDGEVSITDGREEVGENRVVIDRASTNHTRVSTAANINDPRVDLLGPQREHDREEREKVRFAEVFAAPKRVARDRFGNRRDRLSGMNEETIRDAQETMKCIKNEAIKSTLEDELTRLGLRLGTEEAVTAIRTNDELRLRLAKAVLAELNAIRWQLPEQLRSDAHGKSTHHPGYSSNMNTLEYAALLAISMLDGTFLRKNSVADEVQIIDTSMDTKINNGQHRMAALRALNLGAASPEHIAVNRIHR